MTIKQCNIKSTLFLSMVIFALLQYGLIAEDKSVWDYESTSEMSASRFIENRGQLVDTDGKLHPEILYYFSTGKMTAYFSKNSVQYSFSIIPEDKININMFMKANSKKLPKDIDLKSQTAMMNMLNISNSVEFTGAEETGETLNFYYSHCPQGITGVHSYRKIIYKNIYPKIDLVFYALANKSGFKYDYIVHPGANPNLIRFNYSSENNLKLNIDKNLTLSNDISILREDLPFTYQLINDEKKIIKSYFKEYDNGIGYSIGNYNRNKTLIIDPVINWATYYGGGDGDHISALEIDNQTNIVFTGYTLSKNIPVTTSTLYKGAYDAFIAKFDYNGKRLWATYYGGVLSDYAEGLTVDYTNKIYITGFTWDLNFPVSSGCFQNSYRGGQNDGFLMKFSKDGVREWATYIGGERDEHLYGVTVDQQYNIMVAGWSNSRNYPNDSLSLTPKSSFDDAVVTSFNPDGKFKWSRFFTGDSIDAAQGIVTTSNNEYIVSGYTNSLAFEVTPNAYQRYSGGNYEAFYARLSIAGDLIYSTYFGGNANDYATSLSIDKLDNCYIGGYTMSANLPMVGNPYQSKYAGQTDGFIVKFNPNGIVNWSSYLGGSDDDYVNAINSDRNGNVLISGQSYSANFPTTINAYQKIKKGNTDAFAGKFSPDLKLPYWITFYGGTSEDAGFSIAADYYMSVYIAGETSSSDFPVTPSSFQTKHNGFYDGFIFKHCASSPYSVIKVNGKTSICQGEFTELDAGPGNMFYEWTTGETTQRIKVTASGSYSVKVIDSLYCEAQSSPVLIKVNPQPKPKIKGRGSFCEGESTILTAPDGFIKTKWSTGDSSKSIVVNKTGKIVLTVTDSAGCTGKDSLIVSISPKPIPVIHGPKNLCANSKNIIYYVYGVAGHSYQWIVKGGTIDYGEDYFSVQIDWDTLGQTKIYIYQTDNATGCVGIDSMTVNISDKLTPKIQSSKGSFIFCEGDSIFLTVDEGYESYLWNTGDTSSVIIVNKSGSYRVAIKGQGECFGYDTVIVQTHKPPVPYITGDTSVCEGNDTYKYTTLAVDGHQYNWSIDNGLILGELPGEITVKWLSPGKGRIRLEEIDSLAGCTGIAEELNVTISPKPNPKITTKGSTIFCEGDSVILDGGAGFQSYKWSTGDTTEKIIVKISALVSLTVTSNDNCNGSDTLAIVVYPKPDKPKILNINDTLFSSTADSYQWYRDGNLLGGETNNYIFSKIAGRYKVVVKSIFGCINESDEIFYEQIPLVGYSLVELPDTIFTNSGNDISVPLVLKKSNLLNKIKAFDYKAYISFYGYMLIPDPSYKIIANSGNMKSITVEGTRTDTIGLLQSLKFRTFFNDSVCSTVSLDSIVWDSANVRWESKNSVVCLLDICKAYGTRLFLHTGQLRLEQSTPNPASDKVEIEFETIETGRHKLYITDVYGNIVQTIFDSETLPRADLVTISTANFAQGVFFYILETPTRILKRKMQIIK